MLDIFSQCCLCLHPIRILHKARNKPKALRTWPQSKKKWGATEKQKGNLKLKVIYAPGAIAAPRDTCTGPLKKLLHGTRTMMLTHLLQYEKEQLQGLWIHDLLWREATENRRESTIARVLLQSPLWPFRILYFQQHIHLKTTYRCAERSYTFPPCSGGTTESGYQLRLEMSGACTCVLWM